MAGERAMLPPATLGPWQCPECLTLVTAVDLGDPPTFAECGHHSDYVRFCTLDGVRYATRIVTE